LTEITLIYNLSLLERMTLSTLGYKVKYKKKFLPCYQAWERHLMLFPTLGPSRQLLCWSGMTDTEHNTTSRSTKEDLHKPRTFNIKGSTTDIINHHFSKLQVARHITKIFIYLQSKRSSGYKSFDEPNRETACRKWFYSFLIYCVLKCI